MNFRPDGFDLWVFRNRPAGTEYLLLQASKEKADRWFNGSQFWQIPSDFAGDQKIVPALKAELGKLDLAAESIWAAEHTYTIYNRRYEDIIHIAVFAAAVDADAVTLNPAEHAQHRWCDAEEAADLLTFRALKDGLHSVREYITDARERLPELQLA